MFDVAFSEIVVIGTVALVVIGPERLPKVARTAGHLLGRAQRYVNAVKADITREIQMDELKKLHSEMQESARSVMQRLNCEVQWVEQEIDQTVQSTQSAIQNLSTATTQAISVNDAPPTAPTAIVPEFSASAEPASAAHPSPTVETQESVRSLVQRLNSEIQWLEPEIDQTGQSKQTAAIQAFSTAVPEVASVTETPPIAILAEASELPTIAKSENSIHKT